MKDVGVGVSSVAGGAVPALPNVGACKLQRAHHAIRRVGPLDKDVPRLLLGVRLHCCSCTAVYLCTVWCSPPPATSPAASRGPGPERGTWRSRLHVGRIVVCDGERVDGGMTDVRPSPCRRVPRGEGAVKAMDRHPEPFRRLQTVQQRSAAQAGKRVALVSRRGLCVTPSSVPCGPSTSVKLVLCANCPLSRLTREGQQMGVLTKWLEKVTPGTGCRGGTRVSHTVCLLTPLSAAVRHPGAAGTSARLCIHPNTHHPMPDTHFIPYPAYQQLAAAACLAMSCISLDMPLASPSNSTCSAFCSCLTATASLHTGTCGQHAYTPPSLAL